MAADFTANPVTVTIADGAADRSSQLAGGRYYVVIPGEDAHILIGDSTVTATTNAAQIFRGVEYRFYVGVTANVDDYVSLIGVSGGSAGTGYIVPVHDAALPI